MTVCDFSSTVPDFRALRTANIQGVITYCTRFNLSALLVQDALGAGLTVTLVMEAGSQPALRGAAGGTTDALQANQQATAAGYDPQAALYYVAEDPNRVAMSDWPTVDAYFQAVNTAGGRPVGAYGGLALVEHLISVGLARYGWVVETWGGTSPTVHLAQQIGGVPSQFAGIIDVDTILKPDYGQMPRPGQPAAGSGGSEDSAVTILYDGTRWHELVVGTDKGVYWSVGATAGAVQQAGFARLGTPTQTAVSVSATTDGKTLVAQLHGVDNLVYYFNLNLATNIWSSAGPHPGATLEPLPVGPPGPAGPQGPPGLQGPAAPAKGQTATVTFE